MRKRWLSVLAITLLVTLVSADARAAKRKNAPARKASASRVKSKAHGSRARREVSRKGSRNKKRVVYASRGRRGRRVARSRRSSVQPQEQIASGASRPAPGIPPERVTEIQNALIKAGYLDGPASGQYDDATIAAMKDYQSANGLPQTGLPSATLLKKLGVAKRSNDGYAVPVNTVSQNEKKKSSP